MNKKNICSIEEWSVNWNEVGNTLLCSHEYIHETLIITTIYGSIQRLIKIYSERFPTDLSLKRIQYELFKQVMFIQECCATFCSVMQVSDTINNAEHLLPASYLNYYNTYYNCIKSKIKSTYFAHSFAETVAQICMNKPVHMQIIDYLESETTTFGPLHFSPDICFNLIISNLSTDILEEMIEYCNSRNPDPFSDVNSDQYWENRSLDGINQINSIVYNAVYEYISQKLMGINAVSRETIRTNSDSWIKMLNDALIAKYGGVDLLDSNGHVHPYKLGERMLLILECLDTVRIHNQPYMRSKSSLPSEDMIGMNLKAYHKKLNLHTFLCENCFFDTDGNWYKFNSDGTRSDDMYFHYNLLSHYVCRNPLFVVGMTADSKTKDIIEKEIKEINENLENICKDSTARIKNISRYNKMFYMFGKFSCWLDYLVQGSVCKFHILAIDDKNAPATQKRNIFAMIAFYSSSLPGVFVKCFNNISYSKVLQLLDELTKQNLIIPDYSHERLTIGDKMIQAFNAIDAFWFEF